MASRPKRRIGKSTTLGITDQAAYGLSTYLVTTAASHTSTAAELGKFMLLWGSGWLAHSLLSAAFLRPIRLGLTRHDIDETPVKGLQYTMFLIGTTTCFIAFSAQLFPGSFMTQFFAVAAVGSIGFAYALKRNLAYQQNEEGRAARYSLINLISTVPLLALLLRSDQSVTRWGLLIAAAALIPAAAPFSGSLRHWQSGLRLLIRYKQESLWNVISTAASGWVFNIGLISIVTATRGADAAGEISRVLILVAPVQLVSQTLPLMFLHRLATAGTVGARTFIEEWLIELRLYIILFVLGFGTLLILYTPWTNLVLGRNSGVPWFAAAAYGLGLLLGSWATTALVASQSARNLLFGTSLAGLSVVLAVMTKIPTIYLVVVPYAMAILGHLILVLRSLKSMKETPPRPPLLPTLPLPKTPGPVITSVHGAEEKSDAKFNRY